MFINIKVLLLLMAFPVSIVVIFLVPVRASCQLDWQNWPALVLLKPWVEFVPDWICEKSEFRFRFFMKELMVVHSVKVKLSETKQKKQKGHAGEGRDHSRPACWKKTTINTGAKGNSRSNLESDSSSCYKPGLGIAPMRKVDGYAIQPSHPPYWGIFHGTRAS